MTTPTATTHSAADKKWQEKLVARLAEHLQSADLAPISQSFVNKLRSDYPELPDDFIGVARYLVMGQDDRFRQIAHFLTAAQAAKPEKSLQQPFNKTIAYLLQIVVKKCYEESDQGKSRVLVDDVKTVQLLAATRNTVPLIPDAPSSDDLDYENGQKDEQFRNIGMFIPPTGILEDVDKICEDIAAHLLTKLSWKDAKQKDTNLLGILKGILDVYAVGEPENAPFQDLYVKYCNHANSPLLIDAVAARLNECLGDLLWVYIYGGQASESWLYMTEERLKSLLVVHKHEFINQSELSMPKPKFKPTTDNSVFVSYSRADEDFVSTFVVQLKRLGFVVVMDKTHLSPDEDISAFIQRSVMETRATVCMVSRPSLASSWVVSEVINTFNLQNWSDDKKFFACLLDDDFFKPNFRLEATQEIDKKINEINELIPKYNESNIDTNDLNDEKSRYIKHRNDLGEVLKRLKNSLCLDVRPGKLDSSLGQLQNYLNGN